MNSLYYLAAYNATRRVWHRYLVTAPDAQDAQNQVREALESRWGIRVCIHLCITPDSIFKELEQ